MKKYALLLAAGTVIGLASCGNDSNQMTQAQIDSAANAKTEAMQAEMKMKNDSLINAMAMMKADSAANADSLARVAAYNAGKAAGTRTKTTTTTTKTSTTTKPKSDGTKVTDRPGAENSNINGKPEKPKSVSDRPGAEH